MRAFVCRIGVLFVVLLACWTRGASAQAGELVFAVYPFISPSQIAELYAPLRDHMAQALGRSVNMVSAPDFRTFIERTAQGAYDVIVTAPHMGRLAQRRDGYLPLAQTGYQIVVLVVVPSRSGLRAIEDLKGQSIAIGSRSSMTYQLVDEALHKKGLALERDVRVVETPSFSNVLHALTHGEADAGAIPTALYDRAPEEQRRGLRQIATSPSTPGLLILGHPRLGAAVLERLRNALFAFARTPEGAAHFERGEMIDYRPVDEATLKRIDPYTAVLVPSR